MDNRAEVREFLSSRRAKLTPDDVGLPDVGQRRVPGLRRGEVAALAGVSIEYYSKLERGALGGVSASVLDAIARALRLDDAERSHLFNLAQAADGTSELLRPRRRSKAWSPRPSLSWVLDCITGGPALVRNGRMDLLATNPLGRAMHASLYERAPGPVPNFARYTFLDEDSRRFYPDWDTAADTRSPSCAPRPAATPTTASCTTWSASSPPAARSSGAAGPATTSASTAPAPRRFHHTAVGELELAYESVDMVSDPGLTLTIYAAEPASRTAQALALLGSLTATPAATRPSPATPDPSGHAGHHRPFWLKPDRLAPGTARWSRSAPSPGMASPLPGGCVPAREPTALCGVHIGAVVSPTCAWIRA